MCGIYGIASNKSIELGKPFLKRLMHDLAILSESRGKEAAGLCTNHNGRLSPIKAPFSASKLFSSQELKYTLKIFLEISCQVNSRV